MKNYISPFNEFLERREKNKENQKVEEFSLSYRNFIKFCEEEEINLTTSNDVIIKLKENKATSQISLKDVKHVIINDNFSKWMPISEYNYLRKKDIYTLNEFISFSKDIFKNKIII